MLAVCVCVTVTVGVLIGSGIFLFVVLWCDNCTPTLTVSAFFCVHWWVCPFMCSHSIDVALSLRVGEEKWVRRRKRRLVLPLANGTRDTRQG